MYVNTSEPQDDVVVCRSIVGNVVDEGEQEKWRTFQGRVGHRRGIQTRILAARVFYTVDERISLPTLNRKEIKKNVKNCRGIAEQERSKNHLR